MSGIYQNLDKRSRKRFFRESGAIDSQKDSVLTEAASASRIKTARNADRVGCTPRTEKAGDLPLKALWFCARRAAGNPIGDMVAETFFIKSLYVQNFIMLLSLAGVLFLLFRSLIRKKPRHVLVFLIWLGIVFWFFNSPFFGFSAVKVSSDGIGLDYGILSFRNTVLPIDSPWEIKTHMGGIRKNKRLYFLKIAMHQSMKVRGTKGMKRLEAIGNAVERMKTGSLK